MIKTQIQIPDVLFHQAKRISRDREISFAEVVRRGIEYVVSIYPAVSEPAAEWKPPPAQKLGKFKSPPCDWRRIANERK